MATFGKDVAAQKNKTKLKPGINKPTTGAVDWSMEFWPFQLIHIFVSHTQCNHRGKKSYPILQNEGISYYMWVCH